MIVWTYKGKAVKDPPVGSKAFVYYLEFEDGSKYIGKKNLESVRRKRTEGSTRRKKIVSESNWRTYLSSSTEVKSKIKAGDKLIKREILRWCPTTGCANYWELYYQVVNNVLCDLKYLNKWISVKIYGCQDRS